MNFSVLSIRIALLLLTWKILPHCMQNMRN